MLTKMMIVYQLSTKGGDEDDVVSTAKTILSIEDNTIYKNLLDKCDCYC